MGSDAYNFLVRAAALVSIHAPAWGATITSPKFIGTSDVSIHAPAWGATAGEDEGDLPITVSIHAPAWGATCVRARIQAPGLFQSTLPHGERHLWMLLVGGRASFNPRSRMGSDAGMPYGLVSSMKFQSTLPHGERRRHPLRSRVRTCFNPRSRMGSDCRLQFI